MASMLDNSFIAARGKHGIMLERVSFLKLIKYVAHIYCNKMSNVVKLQYMGFFFYFLFTL